MKTDTKQLNSYGRLSCRDFQIEDVKNVSAWFSRDEWDLFLTSSSLKFPCAESVFSAYVEKNQNPEQHRLYTVTEKESGRHAGHFEIKNISFAMGNGTLAHVFLAPEFRSRGLGTDLVRLMDYVAFENLNLSRLGLAVNTVNPAAVCAYVRGGFTFEGIIRDVIPYKGERHSLYQMSLLKPEFENLKQSTWKR